MKIVFPLLLFFLAIPAFAQKEYGMQVCKDLSSEEFYGRGYIKKGDFLAANYIADAFKKLGVQPLSKNNYFQSFSFQVNTFPTDIHLTINGKELAVGIDYIPDYVSGSFTGAWKFRTVATNEMFDFPTLKAIKDSLEKKHYNSVVLSDVDVPSGDSLALFQEIQDMFASFGNVLVVTRKKLVFSIANKQKEYAVFLVKKEVLSEEITTIHSKVEAVLTPHKTQNVVAFIPAKKKKAPYLFFTAHYDHLGGIGNQIYFPGASDNASGIGMLLSLAKHYKEHAARYNLVFIAFAGEEAGLIGSHHYVNNPLLPLSKIKFLINLDLMGNGEDGISIVNGSVFEKEYELFKTINQEKNYLPTIHKRGKAANSDHHFFTEAGVPSFFIYTLGKNTHYHDVFDVYEDLSFAKFDEIVNLFVDFVERLK